MSDAPKYRSSNGLKGDDAAYHIQHMGYGHGGYEPVRSLTRRVINGKAYIDLVGSNFDEEGRNFDLFHAVAEALGTTPPTVIRTSRSDQSNGIMRFQTGDVAGLVAKLAEKELVPATFRDFVAEQESVPEITAEKIRSFARYMHQGDDASYRLERKEGPGKHSELNAMQEYANTNSDQLAAVFEGRARDENRAAEAFSAVVHRDHKPGKQKAGWSVEDTKDVETRNRNRQYAFGLESDAIGAFVASQSKERIKS